MKRFKMPLSYGFLDQVAARGFDFLSLWVVLRCLPEFDLAIFGIATAALFAVNLVFLCPENAIIRDKRRWEGNNILEEYLQGFLLFGQLRILVLIFFSIGFAATFGVDNPYFYTCLFGLNAQIVQMSEISRLDFRVDLQQKTLFRAEFILKSLLLCFALVMFVIPKLPVYIGILIIWSSISATYWTYKITAKYKFKLSFQLKYLTYAFDALKKFSLWQHLSGTITFIIYNIDPLILSLYGVHSSKIAIYTVALKISAIFFAIPMFIQYMVSILLNNCDSNLEKEEILKKMFFTNLVISTIQLFLVLFWGVELGFVFRKEIADQSEFYLLSLLITTGVFFVNIARPLLASMIINLPMKYILYRVYVPSLIASLIVYPLLTGTYGIIGCAVASMFSYVIFFTLILVLINKDYVIRGMINNLFK